jgi:hypothetical protein
MVCILLFNYIVDFYIKMEIPMSLTIPFSIARYIRSVWMSRTSVAYLLLNKEGQILEYGGMLEHYGLSNLRIGTAAVDHVGFLEGMLPIEKPEVLEFLRTESGRSAHIHFVPYENGIWVILFDATAEHDKQQRTQQRLNELSLSTYRQMKDIEQMKQQLKKSTS